MFKVKLPYKIKGMAMSQKRTVRKYIDKFKEKL